MDAANKDLLQRFTDGTATKLEREEFLRRYREGELDHLITPEMHSLLMEELINASPEETVSLKNNYELIVKKYNIEPKVVPIQGRSRSRYWVAAAAVIVIAIVTGLWTINREGYLSTFISQADEGEPSVYSGKQLVELPDGSTVLLNEESELKFTDAFGTSNREVLLIGEALFDVKHDPTKPFIVHTGNVSTTVLGTAFNVNAYPGQAKIKVTVVRGLVQVGDEDRVYGKISPDEEIEVDVTSHDFVKRNAKAQDALAWQKDFIILNDVTLAEAAKILEQKFKVQIKFESDSLKQCQYYGAFLSNESLQDILSIMSNVVHMKYTIEKKGDVIVSGKGCD